MIAGACGAFWSPRVPRRACDVTPRDPWAERGPMPRSYSCLSRWFPGWEAHGSHSFPLHHQCRMGSWHCSSTPRRRSWEASRLGSKAWSWLPWPNSCAQYQARTQTERLAGRHPKPYAVVRCLPPPPPSFSSSRCNFFFSHSGGNVTSEVTLGKQFLRLSIDVI